MSTIPGLSEEEAREFIADHAGLIAAGYEPDAVFIAASLLSLFRLLRIGLLMDESGHHDWQGVSRDEIHEMISRGSAALALSPDDAEASRAMQDFIADRIRQLNTMKYAAYLQTPEWKDVRRFALYRADNRCQVCNSAYRLQVHHRTYDHRGTEHLADVTVLCSDCHKRFHENGKLSK